MEILIEVLRAIGVIILAACAIAGIILTFASILYAITGDRIEF